MNQRTPKVRAAYDIWRKSYRGKCTFCDVVASDDSEQVVTVHTHFLTIRNNFPYHEWDALKVTDHFMLVPKRHIGSLNELTDEELIEHGRLLARYEGDHYSIYTRSHSNTSRTIFHVHTHLFSGTPL